MHRKLYAFLILIWTIWALVLFYLYFFVFYTSQLSFNSNIWEYKVTLYSPSLAQKKEQLCPQSLCIINDVSPFEYNISISKDGYETKNLNIVVWARQNQEILIELQKKAVLEEVLDMKALETPQEKIQRLRDNNLSFARFQINTESEIRFTEESNTLKMLYITWSSKREIQSFPKISADSIDASLIGTTQNIFLSLWNTSYIFETRQARVTKLPFEIKVRYIKPDKNTWTYLIVTENGTFHYNAINNTSNFEYLFRDFVYINKWTIGVIYKDEIQKKSNFWLEQKWNLIVLYNPDSKERKVILETLLPITHIQNVDDKVIFTAGNKDFELLNY